MWPPQRTLVACLFLEIATVLEGSNSQSVLSPWPQNHHSQRSSQQCGHPAQSDWINQKVTGWGIHSWWTGHSLPGWTIGHCCPGFSGRANGRKSSQPVRPSVSKALQVFVSASYHLLLGPLQTTGLRILFVLFTPSCFNWSLKYKSELLQIYLFIYLSIAFSLCNGCAFLLW